ncbi:MAG: glutamate--tRNA ligase family protein, partial [Clostridia bacterium]|nr:glutamate--tRNA ligase family protein [Clostridia bacterium]
KEYISSTPKYQLLYEAFGWKSPKFVHLSTIMGKNADGSVSKLSKRHGSVSFSQLLSEGFLVDAVLNYIALLGWSPKQEREIFSLDELIEIFNIEGLVKTDAIFDYKKLEWMNSEYIKKLDRDEFLKLSQPYITDLPDFIKQKWDFVSNLMQSRIAKLSDIKGMLEFLWKYEDFGLELLENKKNKVTIDDALMCLKTVLPALKTIQNWNCSTLNETLENFAQQMNVKLGYLMWPIRIAVSGQTVTPGGSGEVMYILGKDESIRRIEKTISRLQK